MPTRLLGSYAAPAFAVGDVVTCARRGEVRIVGLSSAPIPWPIGQTLPSRPAASRLTSLYFTSNATQCSIGSPSTEKYSR